MGKYDFTKTHKNVHLSNKRVRRTKDAFNIRIELDEKEQKKYNQFMKHELEFYNNMVSGLGSRTRAFPEHILKLNDHLIKLFAQLAYDGKSVKDFISLTESESLGKYEPYKKILVGFDTNNTRYLNERLISILMLASSNGIIHPLVRKNICLEIVNFFKIQAQKMVAPVTKTDDTYRVSPEFLELYDIISKRHLQMPKSIINIVWDNEKECSYITTPYSNKPIEIPSFNITEEKNWNYIILHQEPGEIATKNTPWVLDFLHYPTNYILKYIDVKNPNKTLFNKERIRYSSNISD